MPEAGWDVLSTLGVIALVLVIVSALVVLGLAIVMIRRHRKVNQPDVPVSAKISYYGSMVYAISPFDVLPDPILIDDIGVLGAAVLYVGHAVKKVARKRSKTVS